jgi:hypothetical protein
MKRAKLVDELERLGRAPAPLPDDARVAAWEQELLHELPSLDLAAPDLAPPRRHRRPFALAAFGAAAAAVMVALVAHHADAPGTELHEVSGAVIVLPDGSTKPLHDGDQLPPGGIVETGPNGRLTVAGRTVGPNQLGLVDGGRVTPLPRTTAEPATTTSVATVPPAPRTPPTSAVTSAVRVAPTTPAPSVTVRTAPASTSAPVAPPKPALVPTTAPPTTAPAPNRAPTPPPAAAPVSRVLILTVTPFADGVHLTWSTPGASSFGRYVVIRASLSLALPKVIGLLPDQSTTSFTDPSPPHGVLLFYRVVAVGPDNHLLAVSRTVSVVLPATTPAPTSQPPSTMTAASSVPTSGRHRPGTLAAASTTTTVATRLTDRADGWSCRPGDGPDGGSDGSDHCDGPSHHG